VVLHAAVAAGGGQILSILLRELPGADAELPGARPG
jgi:hypothetical protein